MPRTHRRLTAASTCSLLIGAPQERLLLAGGVVFAKALPPADLGVRAGAALGRHRVDLAVLRDQVHCTGPALDQVGPDEPAVADLAVLAHPGLAQHGDAQRGPAEEGQALA